MENSKQIFFCENCKKPILVFWDKKGRFCSRSCLSAYTAKNNSNIKASREKQHKEAIQRKIDQKLEKEKINQQESSCPFLIFVEQRFGKDFWKKLYEKLY